MTGGVALMPDFILFLINGLLAAMLTAFFIDRLSVRPRIRELKNSYAAKVAQYEDRRAGISDKPPKPVIPVPSLLPGHTFALPNLVQASVVEAPRLNDGKIEVLCMPLPTGGQFLVKFDPDDVIALEGYE